MDAYLHSSGLDPLRANLPVRSGFSGAQSLFRVCGEILQWDRFTTFARSPVIDDRYNRIYWTTCTSPGLMVQQAQAMTDNSAGYDLGLLQPPAEAPSVTVDRGGPGVSTTPVRFVITLVDTCSYDPGDPDAVPPVPPSGAVETGPSATSNGLAYLDGVDGVSLRTYVPPATCADGSFRYARKRIYALIGGQYYFLDEIPRNQSLWSVEPLVVDTASPVVLPSGPPNAQVAPRATLTIGGNQRDTAFVYTWVSQFGEETQPSPASPVLTYDDGTDCVTVSFPPPPAAPAIESVYLYMAVEGEYYRVAVEDLAALGDPLPDPITITLCPLDDDFLANPDPATGIGLPLLSANYDPPPDDLCGLESLPNGVLAGFTNQGEGDECRESGTVHFSEPYQPHAWPVEYRIKVDYPITALAQVPEGLLVLGLPDDYMTIITGATPQVMRAQRLETYQSCLDARSVVRMGSVVLWSSPDGVAAYGGGMIKILSAGVWSREQWQRLNPQAMVFGRHEERLLIYPQAPEAVDPALNQRTQWNLAPGMGVLYSLERQDVTRLSEGNVTAVYQDGRNDVTWLAHGDQLAQFNAGERLVAHWISRPLVLPGARTLNSARLEIEAETEIRLHRSTNRATFGRTDEADETDEDVPFWTKRVSNELPFRLKSAGRRWNVRIGLRTVGRERVRALFLASDMREIP